VWRLFEKYGVFRSSFRVEPLEMAFLEGQQNDGLALLAPIHQHNRTDTSSCCSRPRCTVVTMTRMSTNCRDSLLRIRFTYLFGTMVGFREVAGVAQSVLGLPGDYQGPASVRLFAEISKLGKQVA